MADLYTAEDIFYELSTLRDPERTACTLAELDVVALQRCSVMYTQHADPCVAVGAKRSSDGCSSSKQTGMVTVVLKPTVPHCSLMGLICICVYAKLKETLPLGVCDWKIAIKLVEGSHLQQSELEKQIADKERVAAAMENEFLMREVEKMMNVDAE